MVQDTPVQDIPIPEQDESLPQTNSEPEMGAAAAEAAVYDTSPSPPHQNPPPIPAETAQQSEFDMILQAIRNNTNEMKEEIKNNTNRMEANLKEETKGMREEMKEMRGEMRQVGRCLQADIMAPPRAATNELRGSAPAGEDRVSRETCRVTEKVTETVTREKLNGVTETCTRHIETREIMSEVTELTETREVVGRLHGVKGDENAHTHTYR